MFTMYVCSQTESKLLLGEVLVREYSRTRASRENKPDSEDVEVVVSLQLSLTLIVMGVVFTTPQMHHCLNEYGEDAMLDAVVQLRKSGINTPVKDLPTKMGRLAVRIPIKDRRPFDPPYDLVAIDVAMREYPM